eukprot:sb/3475213/
MNGDYHQGIENFQFCRSCESGQNQNWTSLLEVVEISSASILPFLRSKSTNTSLSTTQGLFLSGISNFCFEFMGTSDKNTSVIANLYYLQQTCPILILSTLTLNMWDDLQNRVFWYCFRPILLALTACML